MNHMRQPHAVEDKPACASNSYLSNTVAALDLETNSQCRLQKANAVPTEVSRLLRAARPNLNRYFPNSLDGSGTDDTQQEGMPPRNRHIS